MSEKRQKRLVNTHRYLGMLAKKGGLYAFCMALGSGGFVCLLMAALLLSMVPSSWRNRSDWDEPSFILLFLFGGFFGVLCCGVLWLGVKMFKAAQGVGWVAPTCDHRMLDFDRGLRRSGYIPRSCCG